MSNARKGLRSQNKKSEFQKSLDRGEKMSYDKSLSEEKRKERRYAKLEGYFNAIGEKENRYFFYCPDIPLACALVKTIYQHVTLLNEMGYKAFVMHEVKGFKPTWLKDSTINKVPTVHLSEKSVAGKYSNPTFDFTPTDSIIIPDGFWTVMEGFVEIKQVHKIVMVHGYGGIVTTQPGYNWGFLGFTDVICTSEQLKQDYQKLWPNLNYHVVPYHINDKDFEPLEAKEVFPAIGLNCRSREDAQSLINIFKNRYPFLSMFDFRILKKLDTDAYADVLKHCCLQVVVDEKAGNNPAVLEAIATNVPSLVVYGRGYQHFIDQEGVIFLDTNDHFEISEAIAHFCLGWIENETAPIVDKAILTNYTKEKAQLAMNSTIQKLQQHKVQLFTAIKQAVDAGKLDETEGMFAGSEATPEEQFSSIASI